MAKLQLNRLYKFSLLLHITAAETIKMLEIPAISKTRVYDVLKMDKNLFKNKFQVKTNIKTMLICFLISEVSRKQS